MHKEFIDVKYIDVPWYIYIRGPECVYTCYITTMMDLRVTDQVTFVMSELNEWSKENCLISRKKHPCIGCYIRNVWNVFAPISNFMLCIILCCVCFVIVFQLLNLLSLFFKLTEYQKIKLSLQIHSFYIELTDEFDHFDHMVFGNYPLDMLYFSL